MSDALFFKKAQEEWERLRKLLGWGFRQRLLGGKEPNDPAILYDLCSLYIDSADKIITIAGAKESEDKKVQRLKKWYELVNKIEAAVVSNYRINLDYNRAQAILTGKTVTTLQKLLEAEPSNNFLYKQLGRTHNLVQAYVDDSRSETFQKELDTLQQLFRQNPLSVSHQDLQKELAALQEFLEQHPSNKFVIAVKKRLETLLKQLNKQTAFTVLYNDLRNISDILEEAMRIVKIHQDTITESKDESLSKAELQGLKEKVIKCLKPVQIAIRGFSIPQELRKDDLQEFKEKLENLQKFLKEDPLLNVTTSQAFEEKLKNLQEHLSEVYITKKSLESVRKSLKVSLPNTSIQSILERIIQRTEDQNAPAGLKEELEILAHLQGSPNRIINLIDIWFQNDTAKLLKEKQETLHQFLNEDLSRAFLENTVIGLLDRVKNYTQDPITRALEAEGEKLRELLNKSTEGTIEHDFAKEACKGFNALSQSIKNLNKNQESDEVFLENITFLMHASNIMKKVSGIVSTVEAEHRMYDQAAPLLGGNVGETKVNREILVPLQKSLRKINKQTAFWLSKVAHLIEDKIELQKFLKENPSTSLQEAVHRIITHIDACAGDKIEKTIRKEIAVLRDRMRGNLLHTVLQKSLNQIITKVKSSIDADTAQIIDKELKTLVFFKNKLGEIITTVEEKAEGNTAQLLKRDIKALTTLQNILGGTIQQINAWRDSHHRTVKALEKESATLQSLLASSKNKFLPSKISLQTILKNITRQAQPWVADVAEQRPPWQELQETAADRKRNFEGKHDLDLYAAKREWQLHAELTSQTADPVIRQLLLQDLKNCRSAVETVYRQHKKDVALALKQKLLKGVKEYKSKAESFCEHYEKALYKAYPDLTETERNKLSAAIRGEYFNAKSWLISDIEKLCKKTENVTSLPIDLIKELAFCLKKPRAEGRAKKDSKVHWPIVFNTVTQSRFDGSYTGSSHTLVFFPFNIAISLDNEINSKIENYISSVKSDIQHYSSKENKEVMPWEALLQRTEKDWAQSLFSAGESAFKIADSGIRQQLLQDLKAYQADIKVIYKEKYRKALGILIGLRQQLENKNIKITPENIEISPGLEGKTLSNRYYQVLCFLQEKLASQGEYYESEADREIRKEIHREFLEWMIFLEEVEKIKIPEGSQESQQTIFTTNKEKQKNLFVKYGSQLRNLKEQYDGLQKLIISDPGNAIWHQEAGKVIAKINHLIEGLTSESKTNSTLTPQLKSYEGFLSDVKKSYDALLGNTYPKLFANFGEGLRFDINQQFRLAVDRSLKQIPYSGDYTYEDINEINRCNSRVEQKIWFVLQNDLSQWPITDFIAAKSKQDLLATCLECLSEENVTDLPYKEFAFWQKHYLSTINRLAPGFDYELDDLRISYEFRLQQGFIEGIYHGVEKGQGWYHDPDIPVLYNDKEYLYALHKDIIKQAEYLIKHSPHEHLEKREIFLDILKKCSADTKFFWKNFKKNQKSRNAAFFNNNEVDKQEQDDLKEFLIYKNLRFLQGALNSSGNYSDKYTLYRYLYTYLNNPVCTNSSQSIDPDFWDPKRDNFSNRGLNNAYFKDYVKAIQEKNDLQLFCVEDSWNQTIWLLEQRRQKHGVSGVNDLKFILDQFLPAAQALVKGSPPQYLEERRHFLKTVEGFQKSVLKKVAQGTRADPTDHHEFYTRENALMDEFYNQNSSQWEQERISNRDGPGDYPYANQLKQYIAWGDIPWPGPERFIEDAFNRNSNNSPGGDGFGPFSIYGGLKLTKPAQGQEALEQLVRQNVISGVEFDKVLAQVVKKAKLGAKVEMKLKAKIAKLQGKKPNKILEVIGKELKKERQQQSNELATAPQIGGLISPKAQPFSTSSSSADFTTGNRYKKERRFFTWWSGTELIKEPPYIIDVHPFYVDQKFAMSTIFPGLQYDKRVSKKRGALVRTPGATDYQTDPAIYKPSKQPFEFTQPSYPSDIIFNPDQQLIILPQKYVNPVTTSQSQGQVARIIEFPRLQQQKVNILPRAVGDGYFRFSAPFNASVVELRPQGSFTTDLSSRMGTSYTTPPTGSERAGRLVVLPSNTAKVPITQTPFAKGVGYYMMARVGFSAANEIGKANSGRQSWDTTNKNLTNIGQGVTVGLVLAWALPTTALTLGCGIIVHDVYTLAKPRKPRYKIYRVPPPPLKPGGLIILGNPLVNKLKKPITAEMLSHITYSSATPIGKVQAYSGPAQSLDKRVFKLMKQAQYKKVSKPCDKASFYFSYDVNQSSDRLASKIYKIRLDCKMGYHEVSSHILSLDLERKNFRSVTLEFSEDKPCPRFIKIIYPHPHPWKKGKTKPYVVGIDVAKQQMIVNYHHAKLSEEITTYVARTIVPEKWLQWNTDSTMTLVVDYRDSATPKVTAYKSGMEIDDQWSTNASVGPLLKQNNTKIGAKTATELLKLKPLDIPALFGK